MSITQLWGVPVYKESTELNWNNFTIEEKEFIESYEKPFLINHKNKPPGKPKLLLGNPEGKILNHKSLNRISDLVDYHIEIYRKKIMSIQQKLVRTASWITIQEQGDNHQLHNHKQSVVSVSFYPQVDSGKLKLKAVNEKNSFQEHYHFGYTYNKKNVFNSPSWDIEVKSGDIVIFPGYVRHGSTTNLSKRKRVMIGSNYMPTGEMIFIDKLDRINMEIKND